MSDSRDGKRSSSAKGLTLVGTAGFFAAEEYILGRGKSMTVGRSRRCQISLQRTPAYLDGDSAVVVHDPTFRKVSREHFRISFLHPYLIEIENLSGNGTFLDGKSIDRVLLSDFRSRSYEITFGQGQSFRLEWKR